MPSSSSLVSGEWSGITGGNLTCLGENLENANSMYMIYMWLFFLSGEEDECLHQWEIGVCACLPADEGWGNLQHAFPGNYYILRMHDDGVNRRGDSVCVSTSGVESVYACMYLRLVMVSLWSEHLPQEAVCPSPCACPGMWKVLPLCVCLCILTYCQVPEEEEGNWKIQRREEMAWSHMSLMYLYNIHPMMK